MCVNNIKLHIIKYSCIIILIVPCTWIKSNNPDIAIIQLLNCYKTPEINVYPD